MLGLFLIKYFHRKNMFPDQLYVYVFDNIEHRYIAITLTSMGQAYSSDLTAYAYLAELISLCHKHSGLIHATF